jgi:hypothetical protein
MVKKAFMKTVEILLAIVLTTFFVLMLMPQESSMHESKKTSYLIYLESDPAFRELAATNDACFDSGSEVDWIIRQYLPQNYDYVFCAGTSTGNLPHRSVYVDTLFFAGETSDVSFKTLRLYYWQKFI